MPFDQNQYDALTAGVGFADVSQRTQIEISGRDRVKFLNNFCTADLKQLTPGDQAEAFICNVKGKILGHVFIFFSDDKLILDTVPGQADALISHLDRYTLSDDAVLRDATAERRMLVVAGAQADAVLQSLTGLELLITRGSFIGPNSFCVRIAGDGAHEAIAALRAAGAVECNDEVLDAVRIEAGMPLYGRDIISDNLPQEVNRNAQAISFTKGCYLGQETVARIDALGHVNRLLVGVQFFGEQIPSPGEPLLVDGKPVGQVTSATMSPRLNRPLALAYVRSEYAEPGTACTSTIGNAQVVALPP